MQKVYDILNNSAEKEIDTTMVETVLKTQDLLREVGKDDD